MTKARRFSRRRFMGMGVGVGASLLGPSRLLWADEVQSCRPGSGADPLLITIDAKGGWDPTLFCDPVIHPDFSPFQQGQLLGDASMSYAPFRAEGEVLTPYRVGPSDEDFFLKHRDELLIVNGLDTRTNAHEVGARHVWSGSSRVGHPSIGALWAAKLQLDRAATAPLAYISTGGFDGSMGLLNVARAGTVGPLFDLARPFWTPHGRTSPARVLATEAETKLRSWQAARLERQLAGASSPGHRLALAQHSAAQGGELALADFAPCLADDSPVPRPADYYRGWPLVESAHSIIAAMAAGLCYAGRLSLQGFDTHDAHDDTLMPNKRDNAKGHRVRLQLLVQAIDYTVELLKVTGLWQRTTIVVSSDFGRTRYNAPEPASRGKNHWPITSMMLLGAGVRGGRVVGTTRLDPSNLADGVLARSLRLDNGQLVATDDEAGYPLRPAHVHDLLRRLVGINEESEQAPTSLGRRFGLGLNPDERNLPIL